jgi:uncharacterized membrane protein (TIGR02234 family)
VNAASSRTWAVSLLAAGGAAALLSAAAPWARLSAEGGLTDVQSAVTGGQLAPLAVAAGVVALASVVAVLAVQGLLRAFVGGLTALVVVLGLAQVVAVLTSVAERAREWWRVEVGAVADVATVSTTPWAVTTALGLLLALIGSVLVLQRGSQWPGLSRRYDGPGVPAAGASAEAADSADVWRALDRGEDPTVGSGSDPD